ncbi:MAG TPA: hypothetical protein P5120_03720 [Spirochaetota bacterium]|nr:hypothetical protein [Spirochaetota bacterium]HPJ41463.1 hypothetical protein [Spirochaetota bacterium]HPR38628.1 hypothetical protein [Spirochaetota bacterium]HRX46604.1 hypothetical protein [Spirochaetota bacterium]
MLIKQIAPVIISILIIIPSGCIPNYYKDVDKFLATGGKYLIHKNPEAGDYAVYKITGKVRYNQRPETFIFEKERTVSILKIENNEIFISEDEKVTSVKNADTGAQYPLNSYSWVGLTPRRIVTDMDGFIRRSYILIQRGFYRLPALEEGDKGFIKWNKIDTKVPVSLASGRKISASPLWYEKTANLNVSASYIGVNADSNTYEINYTNDGVKFLTTLSHVMIVSKVGITQDWGQYSLLVIRMLSCTPVFSAPGDMADSFIKTDSISFAKSSVLPEKREILSSILKSINLTTTNEASAGNASMFCYLLKEGNKKKDNYKPVFNYGYKEPDEFRL